MIEDRQCYKILFYKIYFFESFILAAVFTEFELVGPLDNRSFFLKAIILVHVRVQVGFCLIKQTLYYTDLHICSTRGHIYSSSVAKC